MPSITNVLNAIVQQCVETAYPNGTAQPSILNTDITIRPGDPNPNRFDALLADGNSNISVNMLDGYQRNVSDHSKAYVEVGRPLPTLSLTVNLTLKTITVTGIVTTGEQAVINCNNVPYVYIVLNTDTVNTIAAALGALIPGSSVVNNVITIPNAYQLSARVGVEIKLAQILKTQECAFQVLIDCPTINERAILQEAIENALTIFYLSIPDDTAIRITWMSTKYKDMYQKVAFYRCQLIYKIRYDTTKITTVPEFNAHIDFINLYKGLLP